MQEIYPILWYFFVYAFLGWCSEVCYAALRTGKFVNRGFLNGPLCPIYGFVLEKLFHQKWWDYSDQPFNLNGYICPLFSLLWGFACLIIMDMIHPAVTGMVQHIPRPVGLVLLGLFLLLTAVDLSATVASMIGLNKRLRQLEEMAARIKAASNELGENLADATLSLSERGADLKEDLSDLRTIWPSGVPISGRILRSVWRPGRRSRLPGVSPGRPPSNGGRLR